MNLNQISTILEMLFVFLGVQIVHFRFRIAKLTNIFEQPYRAADSRKTRIHSFIKFQHKNSKNKNMKAKTKHGTLTLKRRYDFISL